MNIDHVELDLATVVDNERELEDARRTICRLRTEREELEHELRAVNDDLQGVKAELGHALAQIETLTKPQGWGQSR